MEHEPQSISDDLLLGYLLGELAAYEQYQVEEWLSASSGNKDKYEKLAKLWQELELPHPVPEQWDVDFAWQKLALRIDQTDSKQKRMKSLIRRMAWVAASAAVFFVVFILARVLIFPSEKEIVYYASNAKATDTLPDGTVVTLLPGTRLSCLPGIASGHREVSLRGKAFFDVKHDSLNPFEVKATMGSVKVLGTKFLVKAETDTSLYVSVEEGLVALGRPGEWGKDDYLRLQKGEAGIMTKKQPEARPALPARPDEVFGFTGILTFVDEPLEGVAMVLLRTHGINLRFDNVFTARLKVTSTFGAETPEEIIGILAATLNLSYEAEAGKNGFTLKANPGE